MDTLDTVRRIRERHNLRVCSVLLFGAVWFFVALMIPEFVYPYYVHRDKGMFLFRVCEFSILIPFLLGIVFILRGIQKDSVRFGALCPSCGKPLFSWRPLVFGGATFPETMKCAACGWKMPHDPINEV